MPGQDREITDRSPEIMAAFAKVADEHHDPATIKVRLSGGAGYVPPESPRQPNPTRESDPEVVAAFKEFERTYVSDPNEQSYKVYIHHGAQDRFVEYDVFLTLGDPFEIPPYEDWGALSA